MQEPPEYAQSVVLRALMDAAEEGIWDWNVASGDVYFSDRWLSMLGYRRGEIEPHVRSWALLVHPDDLPLVNQVLQRHLAGEIPLYETEHRVRTRNGDWKWILDRGRVVERAPDGAPLRAVGVHLDLSDRRWREETLSLVSHELRNPLTSVLSSCELIQRSALRMNRIVSDLVDLTRMESGKFQVSFSHVHLIPLLESVVSGLERLLRGKRLECRLDLPSDLPLIWSDEVRLAQVFSNLLHNAIKFSPAGAQIWVRAGVDENWVWIEVVDQGKGIDPSEIPHLFERFWQSAGTHAAGGQREGLGLGLFIAQGILISLGGGVSAESKGLGQGSKFKVRLPRREPDFAKSQKSESEVIRPKSALHPSAKP